LLLVLLWLVLLWLALLWLVLLWLVLLLLVQLRLSLRLLLHFLLTLLWLLLVLLVLVMWQWLLFRQQWCLFGLQSILFLLFGLGRLLPRLPALLLSDRWRSVWSACFTCFSRINCLLIKDFVNKILFFEELCPLNFELLGYFPQFGNKHFAQFKNIMHMLRLCRKINKIFSDEVESEKVSPLVEYPDRTVITVQF
jgi:hypothetical protein